MVIKRPENRQSILREEIIVRAEKVADRNVKRERVFEWLSGLNPTSSRAVVFVTSRRLAEELAYLVKLETELAAAPFHAGLSSEVRLRTYDQFCSGDLSVLCATNAFGMGMDIGNIHLIIHFGPPRSLEDYIQEIGRAARNQESLRKAGLEKAKAYLLYEPGDFRKMRDRLQDGLLSSLDLIELHNLLIEEWKQMGGSVDQPLSVRLGRLANRLRGGEGTVNQVRIGLYWLEKLERVEVGFYTPAQIAIEINGRKARSIQRSLNRDARNLLRYLQRLAKKVDSEMVYFQNRDAEMALRLSSRNELFVHLTELARQGVIRYQRKLLLPLDDRRAQESRAGMNTQEWPLVNAALATIREIQDDFELTAACTYTQAQLKERFATVAAEHFQPEDFTWVEPSEREEQAQYERRAFPQCVPAVLHLLQTLAIMRVEKEVSHDGLIYHLTLHRHDCSQWLEALPVLIKESLKNIVSQEQSKELSASVGEVDGQELLLAVQKAAQPCEMETPFSISHLVGILRFLRSLGYLRRADQFVPLSLEVRVTDPSLLVIAETGRDATVLDQFEEQKQLRKLRLVALQAITDLVGDQKSLQEFVEQRYFRATSAQELMMLLEQTLPPGSAILRQLREEALEELLEGNTDEGKPGLSDQQRSVYDAPLDRHLMVVAGPGAGKTHTLLARLVRLVHTEDVRASDILVLAFTRAVVSELRYRLQDLLGQLGYGVLARGIHVTTFHSFVLGTLREFDLVQEDFHLEDKDWFEEFVEHLQRNPVLRRYVATRYRYVFVDEFQDVHGARYNLLKYLAEDRQTYFLVVGDDDQSIYDYERASGEGNVTQYFKDFENQFSPTRFDLTQNYRSAGAIVDFSQRFISALPNRLKGNQSLEPYRSARGMAQWQQIGTDLVTLIHEVEQRLNTSSEKRSQHNTIAILARTNHDVYQMKAQLQQKLGDKFSLLIQGEESRFINRRDVVKVLDLLQNDLGGEQLTRTRLLETLREYLSGKRFKYWLRNQPALQHELWHLAEEFIDGAGHEITIDDFIAYVRDMSRNGNYLRVVARRQAAKGVQGHILLSTIHKVKGIEFPAVILLSSDMRVDDADQELRVMYVGMTRAEDILVALKGKREERLLERQSFKPVDHQRDDLVIAPSLGDVFISKFGYEWRTQQLIFRQVRRGDAITLVRNKGESNPFSIKHDNSGEYIGLLAGRRARKSKLTRDLMSYFGDNRYFIGLEVTGVYRRYSEQDKRYDEEHHTDFYERLCDEVKNKSYYYVVEIGGLVRPR